MVKLPEGVPGPAPDARPSGPQQPGIANVGAAEQAEVFSAQAGVKELADQLAQAGERIMTRDDDIKFLNSFRGFREQADAKTLEALTKYDLSDPKSSIRHNDEISLLEKSALESFEGREPAKIKLMSAMQQHRFETITKVSHEAVRAQDNVVLSEIGRVQNETAARLAAGDIDWGESVRRVNSFIDDRPLPKWRKDAIASAARGEMAEQAIATMLPRVKTPEELNRMLQIFVLSSPDMAEKRRDNVVGMFNAFGKQTEYEKQLGDIQSSFALAFPNESPQMHRDMAIKAKNNLLEFKTEGGQTVVTDKVSGKVYTYGTPVGQPGGGGQPEPGGISPDGSPDAPVDGLMKRGGAGQPPTGVWSTARDLYGRLAGQLPKIKIDEMNTQLRKEFDLANVSLLSAIASEIGEGERGASLLKYLEDKISISPSAFKSYGSLSAEMRAVDSHVRHAIEQEKAVLRAPNISPVMRSRAQKIITAYESYQKRIGYSPDDVPKGIPPGSIDTGRKKNGKRIFLDRNNGYYIEG